MSAQLQLFEARDAADRWTVRVSGRARRLSVRVYPGGRVEVIVPRGAAPASVQRFVGKHRQWIDRRIADLSASRGVLDEPRPAQIELPALGRRYCIDYRQAFGSASARAYADAGGRVTVAGRVEDEQAIGTALRRWLETLAHAEFGSQLASLAEFGGFQYSRLQIRRQRTRWGSCSASGTISLNVCLLFLDPAVVRYLLIHELCHTRHMNHSQRFWSLVESLEPQYRDLDRQLLRAWQLVPGWMFA